MTHYRIVDWDKYYENSRSRAVTDLRWVSVPNKHDGEGYSTIMADPRAAEIFAAWILIIQVSSKCQARGTLLRDNGTPLSLEGIATKTRGNLEWFKYAMPKLMEVGWIEQVTDAYHPSDGCPSPAHHPSAEEEDRIEEKRIEEYMPPDPQGGTIPPPPKTPKAKATSPEEVEAFAIEAGCVPGQGTATYWKWEGNGWTNGKRPIKDWKATIRSWLGAGYLARDTAPGPRSSWTPPVAKEVTWQEQLRLSWTGTEDELEEAIQRRTKFEAGLGLLIPP